ncbi:MAG: ABC transporter substrate-binding protein [Rhodobacteraceae bacterium]|nr:ABC transporter substrate-binding protein [Paracoccaceae bacterium]
MTKLPLTIATTDYDHFRDIRTGAVQPEGIDLNWLLLGHHECFARMTANREFDLSEMSFAKFSTQVTRPDSDLIGLPVICSRLFRFSSFYVNRKSGIERIEDLYGKTVGSPEWAHSAAVWMRGWMQNDVGMDMAKIRWVQAGANAPGREEKVELNLPPGIEITRIKDRSLSDMLAAGDLDCAIIARPPTCFLDGHPDVVRLFPDFLDREERQYAETGVWPIMHIVAMKKSVHEAHPWAARNLYSAFDTSRRRSVERILDPAVSRYPVAWLPIYARKMQQVFGEELFPFGVEANRKTWEMMGLYTYQQGIAHRQFTPEDIFPATIETKVII